MTLEPGSPTKNVQYVVMTAMNRLMAKIEDYAWFEQIALEWLSEDARGVTQLPSLKVKHLQVNPSKQVQLPSDCLRYTKIAVDYGGKLWTLSLCDDITIPPYVNWANPTNPEPTDISYGVYFLPHWYMGTYYGALFGLGGGFNQAYYRIDQATNTLYFLDNWTGREIVIEYLSDGSDITADSLVPKYWIPCLRNYLIWKAAMYRPKEYPMTGNFELEYQSSMIEASIGSGPTLDEMMDAYYDGCGLNLR